MKLSCDVRRELTILARRGKSRVTNFSQNLPTEWRPSEVVNPEGEFERYFTESSAWELIATKLEDNHPVEIINLRIPPGAKGYVMKIDLGDKHRQLYVKLQLGPGKIIGRSFHYSKYKK